MYINPPILNSYIPWIQADLTITYLGQLHCFHFYMLVDLTFTNKKEIYTIVVQNFTNRWLNIFLYHDQELY